MSDEEHDISDRVAVLMMWFSIIVMAYIAALMAPTPVFWIIILLACYPLVGEIKLRYKMLRLKRELDEL